MTIRELKASDLSALIGLYKHLHDADDPPPAPAVVDAVWRELLESRHFQCLGAFADNQLVSSCTLCVIPNLTRGCRPYGVIENVVTHAQHRARGLGKAMLAHTLAIAWARNCYKVMLMTGRNDEATLRFYESAGFDRHAKQAFTAKCPA